MNSGGRSSFLPPPFFGTVLLFSLYPTLINPCNCERTNLRGWGLTIFTWSEEYYLNGNKPSILIWEFQGKESNILLFVSTVMVFVTNYTLKFTKLFLIFLIIVIHGACYFLSYITIFKLHHKTLFVSFAAFQCAFILPMEFQL